MKVIFSDTGHLNKLCAILLVCGLCFSNLVLAELEELDDKNLDEHTGKEGITVDISTKLSIGQIYIDYHENSDGTVTRFKGISEPPPRIEYQHGKQ